MRLDDGGDPAHVAACRVAILEYAREIQPHIPQLADDIRARYSDKPKWPTPRPTKPISRPYVDESGKHPGEVGKEPKRQAWADRERSPQVRRPEIRERHGKATEDADPQSDSVPLDINARGKA